MDALPLWPKPETLTIPQLIRYGFGRFPAAQLVAEVAELHPYRALACIGLLRSMYPHTEPGQERAQASHALSVLSDLSALADIAGMKE